MPPSEQHVKTAESSQKEKSSIIIKTDPKFVYDTTIMQEFGTVPLTTRDESEWYGPWSSLLYRLFPPHEGFQIAPQYEFVNMPGGPEWSFFFVVKHFGNIIACILEVKPSYHYDSHRLRIEAYKQVKKRLQICLEDKVAENVSAIYGLSCIGTRFMIMKLDTRTGQTRPRLRREYASKCIAKVTPKGWWRNQVLTKKSCIQLDHLMVAVRESPNPKLKLSISQLIPMESLPDADVEVAMDNATYNVFDDDTDSDETDSDETDSDETDSDETDSDEA